MKRVLFACILCSFVQMYSSEDGLASDPSYFLLVPPPAIVRVIQIAAAEDTAFAAAEDAAFAATFSRPWSQPGWEERRAAMAAQSEAARCEEAARRRKRLNKIPAGYVRCSARLNPDEVTPGALGMTYKSAHT